jgi:thiamine pyrophosphokinase
VGPLGPRVPTHLLSHSILGVDGGANFVDRMDIWVGDADSFDGKVISTHEFKHPVSKESSDLSLALSLFKSQLLYELHFWGFLGGRLDHELFNLGEILKYLDHFPESLAVMYRPDGKVGMHLLGSGEWRFSYQGTFSIGCVENSRVSLKGECRYPIYKETKLAPLSSYGLSNEAHGEVVINNNGPLFVYFPEGK